MSGSPSDSDLVATWGPFVSNAGTYERSGSTLAFNYVVAKHRNATSNTDALEILHLTEDILETTTTSGGATVRMRFSRAE